jgi:uncharacterized protein Yka (UPF0111/DUF47 family)
MSEKDIDHVTDASKMLEIKRYFIPSLNAKICLDGDFEGAQELEQKVSQLTDENDRLKKEIEEYKKRW